ncbi:aminotransferase class IV family protein [Rhodanobacter umsongensis]|uniref:Aminotransferase class IV family protein n=1 Tax=Rhodanobacter umsongensis TaxID=633153 RepID=A0ABW0JLD5_9GAMM
MDQQRRITINGQLIDDSPLTDLSLINYGHFSSMQVRDGCVRGLSLHLERLDRSTKELFGVSLSHERVREAVRTALAGERTPVSLRINVFSRAFDATCPERPASADLMISIQPAVEPSMEPLRLRSVQYQRDLPHIKHVATMGLFNHRRLARLAGFDDAVFVDDVGRVSEASIWNIAFDDGESIVWPQAPMLPGITLQLMQIASQRAGISSVAREVQLSELSEFRGAFLMHSADIARPVASIDDHEFTVDEQRVSQLRAAYAMHPWEPI